MFTIGCHLSSAKGYLHMAKDAASIDANTFQFFTRNPRGGRAKAIDPKDIAAFAAYAPEHGIERILAHAPYTLNPASDKQQTRDFALMVLAEDLGRMEETPHQLYNMHPGSAVGQPCEVAIAKIADALNQSLLPHQTTTLLLETMAGKGSEIGGTFEELAAIIAQVELESHVGVCLDTCHVWDAGYDIVGDLDGVLEEFDRVIGLAQGPPRPHRRRRDRLQSPGRRDEPSEAARPAVLPGDPQPGSRRLRRRDRRAAQGA